MKPMRVLHVLAQRPSHTGSGTTLGAIVRHAAEAGWEQAVVCGTPADDPTPPVEPLPPERVFPLVFDRPPVGFPLPGMSDVMPYPSSRYSDLGPEAVNAYLAAWRVHVGRVVDELRPDLVHSHHLWLLSSILKDLVLDVPVVTQVHATGLRQMELCPHLAEGVKAGVARNERFLALFEAQARQVEATLGVGPERVRVTGAGYRDDVFGGEGRRPDPRPTLVYAGKYSHAKGLPQLLDAIEALRADGPAELVLHVAGSGAGPEAEALRARMQAMAPSVVLHGQLEPPALAELMRRAWVFVLPSFYEGLPLVLVEAAACGARLVATDLPAVRSELAPYMGEGDLCRVVPMPRLSGPDVPVAGDLPAFVGALRDALAAALAEPPVEALPDDTAAALERFTWGAVYARVEAVWREVLAS